MLQRARAIDGRQQLGAPLVGGAHRPRGGLQVTGAVGIAVEVEPAQDDVRPERHGQLLAAI